MEDIQAYTADDCRNFYSTYYAPNNATLIVVGDFEPEATRALIEAHYGQIPAAKIPTPAPFAPTHPSISPRMTWAKPVAADRGLLAWRAPAQGHPDWLPLQLCVEVLLGGPSSRLHKRLIVDDELASTVSGFLLPTRHPGAIEISVAMTREHRFADAEAAIAEELERLRNQPISAAELAKCHSRYEASFWHELETFDGRAEAFGHYHTVLGDFRALFAAGERVQKITAEDLQRVAQTYLRADTQTVVVAEPSGEDEEETEGDDE
jgi:zinc protease